MTVWLVAQPTPGLQIGRGLARLIGTGLGAVAGAAILYGLSENLPLSLTALALWLALCAGSGSLFRHFQNYGFVVAGLTAAIVVLPSIGASVQEPGLALDRVLGTVIGIVCSGLASLYRVSANPFRDLSEQLDDLVLRCLDRVEKALHHGAALEPAQPLVADIRALVHRLDEHAAGSFRRGCEVERVRRVCGLLIELIALTPPQPGMDNDRAVEPNQPIEERPARLSALARANDQPALAQTLDELSHALQKPAVTIPWLVLNDVDTAAVLRASLRPVVALAIAVAVWSGTAWQTGAMMAMTAALFASLFSSHDQGNQALIQVLIGAVLGAIIGAVARVVLLPQADGLLPVLLCITPVLLLGAWLMRRPATAKMAIDFNMAFLLTAQPFSPPANAAMVVNEACAIAAGVIAAIATFWLILPSTPKIRQRQLAQRVATLSRRVEEASDAIVATRAHRAMRATVMRLLELTDPAEPFNAAMARLAQARRTLLSRQEHADAGHRREAMSDTNNDALNHAGKGGEHPHCARHKEESRL